MPLAQLADHLRPTSRIEAPEAAYESVRSGERTEVAVTLARDLVSRIDVLVGLGLGYLSIDRPTPTLSPGEIQRLRIATQLRSGLFGVVYVLDEPCAGLHPADIELLMKQLHWLVDAGNTVLVVEHQLTVIAAADWVIDLGPGGGGEGGRVVAAGPPREVARSKSSKTARYLRA